MLHGPGLIDEIEYVCNYANIIPSVSNYEYIKYLNEYCEKNILTKEINIEINTGMNRFGMDYENAVNEIKKIKEFKNIKISGVYMHFSTADENIEYANTQKERFDNIIDELKKLKINIPLIHACNSSASILVESNIYNAIRPGIMIYGYYPNEELKNKIKLRPTCTLKSTILNIHEVEKNTPIGYGRKYITQNKTKIGTVNIGYADGVPRKLSNKGKVLVFGKICKIIGNICMDSFMVDITEIKEAKIGTEVIIFDEKNLPIENIANICDTINYEILTGIGNRVIREYIK